MAKKQHPRKWAIGTAHCEAEDGGSGMANMGL
jgi:hypothetical protein